MKLRPDFTVTTGIVLLESKIGVRANFFLSLKDEDDWSFVIKLHALFEAACTHLLLFHFKEPELADVFSRLELSNKVSGKVVFLEKLGMLGKESRKFLSTLSELRNSLVHDVRNAEFSLSELVASSEAIKVKNLAIAFSPFEAHIREFPFDPDMKLGYKEDFQARATVDSVVKRFRTDPKFHIYVGACNVLTDIVDMYGYSDYKQWTKAKQTVFEDLDDSDADA